MKLLVFIILMSSFLCCYPQDNSISLEQLNKALSTELNCDLNTTQIKERIKLINTFFYYERILDSQTLKLLQASVNHFVNDCWEQVKIKYEFNLSVGGGYYSSQLDLNFGGSLGRDNDFYQILEHSEYVRSRKEIYWSDIEGGNSRDTMPDGQESE